MQRIGELVRKGFAPDALAAHAGAGGVAALDHKILDHPVKGDAVVIALLRVSDKIFHRPGRDGGEKDRPDRAHAGVDDRHRVAGLGGGELQLAAFDLGGGGGRRAAAAAQKPPGDDGEAKDGKRFSEQMTASKKQCCGRSRGWAAGLKKQPLRDLL